MIIFLAPLIMLAGLLAYALSANPKIAEIGRIAFAFGLLVSLLEFAGRAPFHLP
jgi:hypothetical protein